MPKDVNIEIKDTSTAQDPLGGMDLMEDSAIPARAKTKPLLEGINSPVTQAPSSDSMPVQTPANPKLTVEEKKLISETAENPIKPEKPRLLPEKVMLAISKPKHNFKKIFSVGLSLIVLVVLGYFAYTWQIDQRLHSSLNNYAKNLYKPREIQIIINSSSSPGTTLAASTSSSTIINLPPQASSTPASTTPTVILKLKVNNTPTGYLNVRSAPSLNGKILTKIHPGDVLIYTTTQNGWYFIILPDSNTGWVSGQYVTKL